MTIKKKSFKALRKKPTYVLESKLRLSTLKIRRTLLFHKSKDTLSISQLLLAQSLFLTELNGEYSKQAPASIFGIQNGKIDIEIVIVIEH